MCEALRELMKDELDAKKIEGEKLINELIIKLDQAGRTNDIVKAAKDKSAPL